MNVYGETKSLQVERNGKWLSWNWVEYYDTVYRFGRALVVNGVTERSSVNILGFNSPEWVFAFLGAIFANCVAAGVYTTNNPEACQYVAETSGAEVIVVEN